MFCPLQFAPILIAALAQVPFQVYWSTSAMKELHISVAGLNQQVLECLESSRQSRMVLEVRICRREPAWFDSCLPARSGVHTIEFDPITESYRVVSDMLGDGIDPVAVAIPSRPEAIETSLQVRSLPLDYVTQDDVTVAKENGSYIQVRAITSCRGSSPRFFAHISEILTLGLLDVVETPTEWYDFNIASDIVDKAKIP